MKLLMPLMILLLFSCKPSQKYDIDQEYIKVLAIHDEVMPKMGYISSLQRSLKTLLDTMTIAQDSVNIRKTIQFLADSEEGMWVWMNQIKKPVKNDLSAAKAYLENEIISINKVKEDMIESINQGEALIKKYKTNN